MGKNIKYGEFKFGKSPARPTSKGYAKGGAAKGQAKVEKVMSEFKSGDLHSGSKKGPVVKNPKQAMAIALSEKKAAGYEEGGTVTPSSMMKDKARSKEMSTAKPASKPVQRPPMTERERQMLKMAKEKEMDRKMTEGERARLTNDRMLGEAMNPLSMIREMYDRVTDRSGESATENMKRYGMKKGGSASHDDIAKDKPMVKKMIHKHEKAMHPGKPLTKMKKGGVPVHNRNAKIC
jgi:hypothetical protein